MRLKDWVVFENLCSQCELDERRDTFYPFFANCNECHGFVFSDKTDVQRQLGACGCFVAMQMEIEKADLMPTTMPRALSLKVVPEEWHKKKMTDVAAPLVGLLPQERPFSRAALYHLRKAADSRSAQKLHVAKAPTLAYNKMKTRFRMPRDAPRRAVGVH